MDLYIDMLHERLWHTYYSNHFLTLCALQALLVKLRLEKFTEDLKTLGVESKADLAYLEAAHLDYGSKYGWFSQHPITYKESLMMVGDYTPLESCFDHGTYCTSKNS